ncbi:MAG: SpoIVB peptidase [Clostridia bacterium]|nr:SpoIVB peptidase [Clostridia bacterium]
MKKFIKQFDIVLSVFCSVVFCLVALGQIYLPDKVVFFDGNEKTTLYEVFTVNKTDDSVMSVSTNGTENSVAEASLLGIIPVRTVKAENGERKYVNVSGDIIGICLYTDGLLIVGVEDVVTEDGNVSPATVCGLQTGDIITQVNDEKVVSVADFSQYITNSKGNSVSITAVRDNKTLYFSLTPAYCESEDKYRCGLWLRDSTAGIGTMTFVDPESGVFAALGHSICDSETQSVLTVGDGDILTATVTGITKGEKGATGQLLGSFADKTLGELIENNEFGVYGTYSENDELTGELMAVATQTEIKAGDAQILCNIDGNGVKYYDIEIEKISYSAEKQSRSMVIEITDDELLNTTGGIVQGMSGSPIVQDGMLIGAVTHVFLNDPTRGYAIFAETMIDTADSIIDVEKR